MFFLVENCIFAPQKKVKNGERINTLVIHYEPNKIIDMKPYILTRTKFLEERNRIREDLKCKTDKHKYQFRLYDDDGELYYEGLCVENYSFYPLDEEQPNTGVTEIHYFNNGKWEQL